MYSNIAGASMGTSSRVTPGVFSSDGGGPKGEVGVGLDWGRVGFWKSDKL